MEMSLQTTSILVAIALVASFLVTLVLLNRHSKSKELKQFEQGLNCLLLYRQLLGLIQQHRGLSNGVLCGDNELQKRISPLQGDIQRLVQRINHNHAWLAKQENWLAISEHWQRLSKSFTEQTASNNLQQHNKLIANVLFLIDDIAEQHRLYELKDKDNRSIRYLWQDLLVTAENIGQARAIGTGVAAAQTCTSVDRIRLSYLHQAIERVSTGNKTAKLLDTIQQEVILDQPLVKAQAYFELATQALEEVFNDFDASLAQAQQSMNA
ncbi:hypothetical protein [Vibrio sp. SCSIO 43136]|uniref:hypothetical protein n=1 Tax=Vibrio sp. SCSIO 43136 TaxID=2819101 RepID=UPI002075AA53|nr:hypothetical protein [Vibrio sp. SCSIO 43136]USD67822.1 hypothetical protein J4N39_16680 [Vibrio sp. SCSIO 43136]